MNTDILKDDPRYVEAKISGTVYGFFFGPYGLRLAKAKHGIDALKTELSGDMESELEAAMTLLWVAHLPFSPETSRDDFEVRFALSDMAALAKAAADVMALQVDAGGDAKKKRKAAA